MKLCPLCVACRFFAGKAIPTYLCFASPSHDLNPLLELHPWCGLITAIALHGTPRRRVWHACAKLEDVGKCKTKILRPKLVEKPVARSQRQLCRFLYTLRPLASRQLWLVMPKHVARSHLPCLGWCVPQPQHLVLPCSSFLRLARPHTSLGEQVLQPSAA